jgi:hypothetical protein
MRCCWIYAWMKQAGNSKSRATAILDHKCRPISRPSQHLTLALRMAEYRSGSVPPVVSGAFLLGPCAAPPTRAPPVRPPRRSPGGVCPSGPPVDTPGSLWASWPTTGGRVGQETTPNPTPVPHSSGRGGASRLGPLRPSRSCCRRTRCGCRRDHGNRRSWSCCDQWSVG